MKLTKSDRKRLEADFIQHNKTMKRQNNHQDMFASFDDYLAYRFGIKQKAPRKFVELKTSNVKYRRRSNAEDVPSKMPIVHCTEKCKSNEYSGSYIVGIATMHKSNLTPIGKDDNPKNYFAKSPNS